jgi:hypothetical protein
MAPAPFLPAAAMADDGAMRWLRRRPRRAPRDTLEEWLATAATYAEELTRTGARCHLHEGGPPGEGSSTNEDTAPSERSPRFCHWRAEVLQGDDPAAEVRVGVRCTMHPGGRYLDASARLAPEDFAPVDQAGSGPGARPHP